MNNSQPKHIKYLQVRNRPDNLTVKDKDTAIFNYNCVYTVHLHAFTEKDTFANHQWKWDGVQMGWHSLKAAFGQPNFKEWYKCVAFLSAVDT